MWNFIKNIFSFYSLFQKSYLFLFFMLFASIFFSSTCINNYLVDRAICDEWLQELSINLVAETTGILMVLFSVNKTVRENREKEKSKFKQIAFRQLRFVLRKQIYLFFEMFKASVKAKPEKDYQTLADLFDDTFFDEVHYLDLLKMAPILNSEGEKIDWLDYLVAECHSLKQALEKVVDRYAVYLESDIVDLMEEITDAPFIRFITSIWEAKKRDGLTSEGDLLFACDNLLRDYTEALVKLVQLYNSNVGSDRKIIIDEGQWKQWWSHKGRPQIGDSRVERDS